MKKTADDFEQRFGAFIGGRPLSKKVALKGMADVEKSLTNRFRNRASFRAESAELYKRIQAPIYELVGKDKRVVAGLRDFNKMNSRVRSRTIYPPPSHLPKIAPRITSGSILSIFSKPYDYQWVWTGRTGSGSATAGAIQANGTFRVDAAGNRGGSASASAGVGKYFRPISDNAFVRFSPYVEYNYFWYDNSTYVTAHNDGYVGVFVQSFDLNGGNPRTEVDIRPSLWSDGTSWFQVHYDEQSGIVWAYSDTVYFPATSARQYIVWVWCNVSCDDDTNDLGSSFAMAQFGINVGFMFFEQWT
jgi:hypothetical protein